MPLRKLTDEQLSYIISKHGLWWHGRAGGERADLSYCDLIFAQLDRVQLQNARLDGARLDGASLYGASLDGASLDGASLYGASLDGASLYGASLYGASLYGASLDGARLYGASLYGASLYGARLDQFLAEVRAERIDMAQLERWGACSGGTAWAKKTLGGTVNCIDLFTHGKEDWHSWLFSRVLTLVVKRRRKDSQPETSEAHDFEVWRLWHFACGHDKAWPYKRPSYKDFSAGFATRVATKGDLGLEACVKHCDLAELEARAAKAKAEDGDTDAYNVHAIAEYVKAKRRKCWRCGSTDIDPSITLTSCPPQYICRKCNGKAEPQQAEPPAPAAEAQVTPPAEPDLAQQLRDVLDLPIDADGYCQRGKLKAALLALADTGCDACRRAALDKLGVRE